MTKALMTRRYLEMSGSGGRSYCEGMLRMSYDTLARREGGGSDGDGVLIDICVGARSIPPVRVHPGVALRPLLDVVSIGDQSLVSVHDNPSDHHPFHPTPIELSLSPFRRFVVCPRPRTFLVSPNPLGLGLPKKLTV